MLYDKRWDRTETKPNVFSLESLIAWLEKQPADGEFKYISPTQCMLCQYFRANGIEVKTLSLLGINTTTGGHLGYPRIFATIANDENGHTDTFGAALARARDAMSSRVPSADRGSF